ncbi:protein FAR1-RELATED SEQUENCE 5-like [Phalaenopsis equestris]|uniref:protein FAR1-RELATED SEQUENCE 5-like n=1 Tax=Phalaenopsis equestris TaxID=78828 RepID=UPI0009E3C9F5|nr:protein FAR1-RELATED SEQUENCE 5-like [Phalaenopsis equestris]
MQSFEATQVYNDPIAEKFLSSIIHSEEEAYESYRAYAHHVGFTVRKDHTTYWPNSKKLKVKDYICGKAGYKKEPNNTVKFRKADTRTGCKAMVRFHVDFEGNWKVAKFIENHNHPLADRGDKHLLRSNRRISGINADVLRSMTGSGIRATHAYNFIATEVGGVENLECTKRDAFNFIQRERRERIEQGDVNALIQLFMERQSGDSMFAWDFQTDESGRLTSIFWSDGLCRLDYDCFGDVIIFDTSYRLNKYNLCCAPFVGVNHHWQNVLFGVGFLSDETTESFMWLFKSFIRIMGDKHPITIFTDQDQAMARAIAECLPQTRHRLCQWHIYKKLPSKVHCGVRTKSVAGLFYKCLSKCDSEEEFEETWSLMIEFGELESNVWLDEMYRIRHKWSTAFNKDIFGMGILSTQRSESTNNVCHGVSKPTSSLTDCFIGLENIMKSWRRSEKDEDFKCGQSVRTPMVKINPMLRQASSFYTRKLYSMFEQELLNGLCGLTYEVSVESDAKYYVSKLDDEGTRQPWNVLVDKVTCEVTCSCKKFEMMGLLCSHALFVLSLAKIKVIPEKYFLLRWSINAKRDMYNRFGCKELKDSGCNNVSSSSLIFSSCSQKFAYKLINRAQGHELAEECLWETFRKLSGDIEDAIAGRTIELHKTKKKHKPRIIECNVNDPAKKRPKGVSTTRLKGHWERNKKAKRMEQEAASSRRAVDAFEQSLTDCLTQENYASQLSQTYSGLLMDSISETLY